MLTVQEQNGQYGIILDQTAFYPVGGGQPSDKGLIRGKHGEAIVEQVRFENDHVVHIGSEIRGRIGQGEQIMGAIDWDRRYALMRNHTLAHLLAEAIRKATGLSLGVVSSGLDAEKARLDLAYERSMGLLLPEIERIANKIIGENRSIEIKIMPRKQAEEHVTRFHESLKTLPPQVKSVRIVEIKDWHACACGGTHVKNVGEIGEVKILRRMSKGKGVERIEFRAKTT